MIEVQYNPAQKSGCTPAERSAIIAYMKAGKEFCASPSIRKDVVTGDRLPVYDYDLTDEVYLWNSAAIYYFEKYDFDLSEDFKKYVMKKQ